MNAKRLLITIGIILVLTGVVMMLHPDPEPSGGIYEETKTDFEETEQKEDIHDTGAEQDGEAGQAPEVVSQATVEVTWEEAQELMKLAYCEAGNQGITGQRLVMSVVLNRVASDSWPDSIHEVIYQDHQFATKGMEEAAPTPETHLALAQIEMGNVQKDIIGFEVLDSTVLDQYFCEAFTHLDHKFYKEK